MKAELDRRGLNPRVDTENSFHVKDPDGFDLQISGKGMNRPRPRRRQGLACADAARFARVRRTEEFMANLLCALSVLCVDVRRDALRSYRCASRRRPSSSALTAT